MDIKSQVRKTSEAWRAVRVRTCIYALKEAVLGVLWLALPAVAGVEVLRQELHFLLQDLLHSAVRNALGIHQHGLPQGVGVQVWLRAALPRQCVVIVRGRFRVLFVVLAILLARMCVVAAADALQTSAKGSVMQTNEACAEHACALSTNIAITT